MSHIMIEFMHPHRIKAVVLELELKRWPWSYPTTKIPINNIPNGIPTAILGDTQYL